MKDGYETIRKKKERVIEMMGVILNTCSSFHYCDGETTRIWKTKEAHDQYHQCKDLIQHFNNMLPECQPPNSKLKY